MAPVRFRGRMYGHLAAVDSGPDRERRPSDGRHLSEFEFGTKEATLVEAAAAMLATHCRNASLLQSKERLVIGVIRTLGGAVDARDPYTKGHSDRVALYAREIAREMGIDEAECQRIYVTGLLHDVGKIGVPDAVLKKPDRLTDEEYEIIKQHPRQGFEILKDLDDLSFTLPGVMHHHERIDGKGYPAELADQDIPLAARILAVADAYDAMTSSRAYRQCMSFERAEQIVRGCIGTQFDPQAAAAFLRILPRIHEIALSDPSRLGPVNDVDDALPAVGPAPPIEIDTAVASLIDV
jgi:HD-GYP domain-containing protein (c-di-GMP phosphodiesterase class II)